jgi:hypothetical protein
VIAFAAGAGYAQNPVVNPPNPQSDVVVSLSEFLPGNTPFSAFAKAFNACRERHAAKLVIPPGRYVFDDPAISSNPLGSHIPVPSQTDLVIEGQGAELVFHYNQPGISFTGCQRVLLRDVAIDWDFPMASPGRVVRMSDGRVAVRVADGYPVSGTTPIDAVSEFDVAKKSWARSRMDFTSRFEVYYPRSIEMVAPQTFYSPDFVSLQEGLEVLVRHYVSGNSDGILGDTGNEDLTFERVTIYGSPGPAFSFSLAGRGIRLSACKILLKPGTDRFSTSNGGANFNGTRGDIIVEDCDFSGEGDDSVNIAGYWLDVRSTSSSGVVELTEHFGTQELMVSAGDRVRFASSGDFSPRGEYDVLSAYFDKTRSVLMVTLDRPPTSVQAGDLAIDLARISSDFLVRRNYFHNNRGRGMMIQTANGRVENNTVENVSQGGIRLTTDAAYFWQGPGCDNVVVTANTFRSCDWGTYARYPDSTVVSVDAYVLTTAIARYPVNKNIIIEKNIITNAPGLAILISSASGVTVDSNEIIDANLLPFPTDFFPPFAGSLTVTYASSVIIRGNKQTATQPAYAAGIFVDRPTTSDVTLTQNAMSIVGARATHVVAPRR